MADRPAITLPPDASDDEAAAITAAVERLLAEEARAAGDGASLDEDSWTGRRFAFAGRVEKLTGEAAPPPRGSPVDPWTAIGRIERG